MGFQSFLQNIKWKVPVAVLALLISSVNSVFVAEGFSDGDRVCATTAVRGRRSGSLDSDIVLTLSPGSCGTLSGGKVTKDGYTWYEVKYNGQTVWVAGKYLRAFDSNNNSNASSCSKSSPPVTGCPKIISRSEWGARPASNLVCLSHQPVRYAFIHHSATSECSDQSSCSREVRGFQNYHMDSRGWSDIGYSFIIGGDGQVYEGRGWDRVGAHTLHYNDVGLGFCFIGNFQTKSPPQRQIDTVKRLIACGVSNGKLESNYTLRGHRDVVNTQCPGDRLYSIIKEWPHY